MRRAGVAMLVSVLTATVGCTYTTRDLAPRIPENAQSSKVLAADGTLITTLHAEENREEIPLGRVPLVLQQAVVDVEDERFWLHRGVDVRAVLRALRANAELGGVEQGGSTITQQLVKNTLLDSEQTLERKVQEASLAWQLEERYTKSRILELYLNTIYFGNGAYGVQAAAFEYFGRPVDQLTLPEAALLAGLIRSPNRYDPYDLPDAALARRAHVLGKMLELGHIDQPTHDAAAAMPLTLAPPSTPLDERYPAAHLVEEVKQWILHDPRFGESPAERRNLLFTGGLRIHTTVDLGLQAAAEAAVAAVLPDPEGPEVAIVSVEPETGYVRALVGGRDFFGPGAQAKFDLAVGTTGRQTGSAFKPFVLAAAIESGMPLSTMFPAPGEITLQYDGGRTWPVGNYGEGGPGVPVNLVEATVRSYNTVFAQLILEVGVERAVETAASMGITTKLAAVPSAVLGANEAYPRDMASAYATLANRGVHVTPVMVTRISRADGTILYEAHHEQRRALSTDTADTVTAVLQQAVERGTGTAARIGRPVAGKTGTNQNWRDAWFCGFTPQLATAVWVGFPFAQVDMVPPTTPIRVTGGSYPAQIWQRYMAAAMEGLPVVDFPPSPVSLTPTTVPTTAPPVAAVAAAPTTAAVPPANGAGTSSGGPAVATSVQTRPTAPTSPDGKVVVPSVVGTPYEEAVATLGAYDLVAARNDVSSPIRKGRVIRQDPRPGARVAPGSTVVLSVSA